MILLKFIDSRKLLRFSGYLTFVLLIMAIFGNRTMSFVAFPTIGFSISMMYSIVFSLGMNSAPSNHGSFAGILCSSIVGGAVGPLIISALSDIFSLRIGMCFIFLTVGYMTFLGFWSKPLVNNKTVRVSELFRAKK